MRFMLPGLLLATLLMQGCADLNISNPFESSTVSSSETYYDQFSDVPIPRDMSVDTKRSLVSVSQEGVKTGLVTVEGRVDKPSLANAMVLNMNRQGWNPRGVINGARTILLFEKDNRYTIAYIYEQTTSVAMEIWVMARLADGVLPSGINSSTISGSAESGGSSPSFYLAPNGSNGAAGSGSVQQQGLQQ